MYVCCGSVGLWISVAGASFVSCVRSDISRSVRVVSVHVFIVARGDGVASVSLSCLSTTCRRCLVVLRVFNPQFNEPSVIKVSPVSHTAATAAAFMHVSDRAARPPLVFIFSCAHAVVVVFVVAHWPRGLPAVTDYISQCLRPHAP